MLVAVPVPSLAMLSAWRIVKAIIAAVEHVDLAARRNVREHLRKCRAGAEVARLVAEAVEGGAAPLPRSTGAARVTFQPPGVSCC